MVFMVLLRNRNLRFYRNFNHDKSILVLLVFSLIKLKCIYGSFGLYYLKIKIDFLYQILLVYISSAIFPVINQILNRYHSGIIRLCRIVNSVWKMAGRASVIKHFYIINVSLNKKLRYLNTVSRN